MELEQPETIALVEDREAEPVLDVVRAKVGTGALPPLPEEDLSQYEYAQSNGTNIIDPSEEPTRKNKIPDLMETEFSELKATDPTNEFDEGSDDITRKNELLPESTSDSHDSEEGVDILSILDLQFEEDDLLEDPLPRQLSVDQLTPTDWISELDSYDDLPTMADMLPKPTPEDPGDSIQKESSNVMDMLFGDTGGLEEDGPDEPKIVASVHVPEIADAAEVEVDESEAGDLPISETGALQEEEGAIDSWLDDVITEFENTEPEVHNESISDGIIDELPDWMDLGEELQVEESGEVEQDVELESVVPELAEVLPEEVDLEEVDLEEVVLEEADQILDGASESELEGVFYEEQNSLEPDIIPHALVEVSGSEILGQDMNHGNTKPEDEKIFSDEPELDDDSLDWLTEDLDDEPDRMSSPQNGRAALNQTRNLSEVDLPADMMGLEDDEAESEGTAVQAELPNWIKQMAPSTERESGITIEEEDDSLIDDDQLSEIIATMESDTAFDHAADLPTADEVVEPVVEELDLPDTEPMEELIEELHEVPAETAAEFDFALPGIEAIDSHEPIDLTTDEDMLHAESFDSFDSEEDDTLLQDAISAIQSEINDIKTDELPAPQEDDEDDLPDWLPNVDHSSSIKPTQTEDLPDWLQRPQTEPLDPSALGYIQGRIDEIKSMQDDSEEQNPASEIEKIISEHTSKQDFADPPNTAEVEEPVLEEPVLEELTSAFDDGLAQFDWSDIEEDSFDTESEFVMKNFSQAQTGSLTEDALDLLPADDEHVAGEDDSPLEIDESFDWLSGGADEFIAEETGLDAALDQNIFEDEALSEAVEDSIFDTVVDEPLDSFQSILTDEDGVDFDPTDDFMEMPDLPTVSELLDTVEESAPNDIADDPQITFEGIDEASEDESLELAAEIEAQAVPEPAIIDDDMSAWDEMESAFEPLIEFDDENDVFSGVRDNPKIYETISAESLAAYQQEARSNREDAEPVENVEEAVDFLNALSDAQDDAEMPSWANELTEEKEAPADDGRSEISPLQGIDDIVEVAPTVAKPVSDLKNLHAPQMMEPVAHRRKAHLAAQAAGTVPMSDPTQPVVVPKERQRYQPRFDANQFDGRMNHEKSKRNRRVGFLIVAAVLAIMVVIALAIPWVISLAAGV